LVSVLNVLYTVDINILHHVFSKYGTILKIVIFNKSAGFQALIQFLDVASAVEAKLELDGQNIYSGCCTLRIQFSSLQDLKVKYNNEKSRDFTNPNLPTTPAAESMSHPNSGVPMMDYNPYAAYGNTGGMKSLMGGSMAGGSGSMGGTPVLIVSGIDTEVCPFLSFSVVF
jgi:polypyrimidine tract-binding protein 2